MNFCSGKQTTNGMQIMSGSCHGIPMSKIPATKNMISAMITNPQPGDKVTSDTTFKISVQTVHLNAGFFVNPTTNYYTAPQQLDDNGDIIGHCHVTVQDIGALKSTTPPGPRRESYLDASKKNSVTAAATNNKPSTSPPVKHKTQLAPEAMNLTLTIASLSYAHDWAWRAEI